MKKNKIIGLLVAAAGSVASISAAAALYVKGATDAHFGIGAEWHGLDGTITYKVNDSTSGVAPASYLKADGTNGGTGFSCEYTQAHFSFALGASYSSDVPAQNFVVGNFAVNLTNISTVLQNNAKIWVGVNGYTEKTIGASTYANAFMTEDANLTAATYSVDHDLAVSSSGAQSVEVYVKLNSAIAEADMMSLAEGKAFDISVSWGAPTNFEFAHVVGNKTQWQEDDVFAMVPNINASAWEWTYNNLPGDMGFAKCKKGETWSSGDNVELDPAKTYDVYWSGDGTADANFVAQGA